MACSPISLRCVKSSYITDRENRDSLFSGLVVTEGASSTYLKSPYAVTFSGDMAVVVDAEKKTYSIRLSSVKQSKTKLKELLADCNCCAGDDEVGNRNYLVADEGELPLSPKQGDIAIYSNEQIISIFDGVSWFNKPLGAENIIDVIYEDFMGMVNNNSLVEGQMYKITDYVTAAYYMDGEQSTADFYKGSVEPIIVFAISANSIHSIAYSPTRPNDIIYYKPSPDGLIGGFVYDGNLVPDFKGFIYRRIDTFRMIDLPFDFLSAQVRRWAVAADELDNLVTTAEKGKFYQGDGNLFLGVLNNNMQSGFGFAAMQRPATENFAFASIISFYPWQNGTTTYTDGLALADIESVRSITIGVDGLPEHMPNISIWGKTEFIDIKQARLLHLNNSSHVSIDRVYACAIVESTQIAGNLFENAWLSVVSRCSILTLVSTMIHGSLNISIAGECSGGVAAQVSSWAGSNVVDFSINSSNIGNLEIWNSYGTKIAGEDINSITIRNSQYVTILGDSHRIQVIDCDTVNIGEDVAANNRSVQLLGCQGLNVDGDVYYTTATYVFAKTIGNIAPQDALKRVFAKQGGGVVLEYLSLTNVLTYISI